MPENHRLLVIHGPSAPDADDTRAHPTPSD